MTPKARTAGPGAVVAAILVVMATLSALASAACASHDAPAPAATDGPPPTLREALSPGQLSRVALLDGLAPFPPTIGRAVLLVDGGFYAQAPESVRSYVREQLQAGVPVVLFGDQAGYEALRGSARAAADLTADPVPEGSHGDGGSPGQANPEVAARGLKIYPSRSGDEPPGSAAIEVAGSPQDPAPIIEPLIRWAEACGGGSGGTGGGPAA